MDNIEKKILEIIDSKSEEIKAFGRDIWTHAELGYREFRTAEKFNEALKKLGVDTVTELAVTGVKGYSNGKTAKGVNIALMGEFDALPITNHKDTNKETGAAHCCGHNAQITGVIGAALALEDPEVKAALGANMVYFGVPAEEFVDIEYKMGLREKGIIQYGGGKSELLRIGAFDDLDMTIGHHTYTTVETAIMNCSTNGFVNKSVKFIGKSAHAAGSPEEGIDALAAAGLAMHAIDAQRESFMDKNTVRIHGFISRGGEAVNVIADNVTMEYSVRAKYMPAIKDASYKVDRALKAAASAMGCGLEITTLPGYLPVLPATDISVLEEVIKMAAPDKKMMIVGADKHETGSTDYGELSSVMPLLQFATGGYVGSLHNPNVDVVDEDLAYVVTAKIFALCAYRMAKDGAAAAKKLKADFKAATTKQGFIDYMEEMFKVEKIDVAPVPDYGVKASGVI